MEAGPRYLTKTDSSYKPSDLIISDKQNPAPLKTGEYILKLTRHDPESEDLGRISNHLCEFEN
jgi:hypothetical protein